MREWIKLAENVAGSFWPDWQHWLFNHPEPLALLDDPTELLKILPAEQRYGDSAIKKLRDWVESDRKVYRVIGVAGPWDEDNQEVNDQRAAIDLAKRLAVEECELGCHWSRNFHGDPKCSKAGGASMGYDCDAEGHPMLLAGYVPDLSSVAWGETIVANIAYPHEEEITVSNGKVFIEYAVVDERTFPVNRLHTSGPYFH